MAFHGNGLYFREVERTDLPTMRFWRNDPAMTAGWLDPRSVQTDWQQETWYHGLDKYNQAFIAVDDDVIVGLLRFRLNYEQSEARLTGTDVLPDHQGKGYGKRILRSGAEYVIHQLNFHRCTAEALESNTAAIHIIRAAAFRPEGTLRDYVYRDGKWHNWHLFSLLKGEI